MSNIIFRAGSAATNGHRAELIVDGVDITERILAEGFKIDRTGLGEFDQWYVQVRLPVDSLEVELPEAVVRASREEHVLSEDCWCNPTVEKVAGE